MQITVVLPRVSTDKIVFTTAFRLPIFTDACVNARVTVGSNPSGTLATIIPIAKMRLVQKVFPIRNPTTKKINPIIKAKYVIFFTNKRSSFCMGVRSRSTVWDNSEIEPIWVDLPVFITRMVAFPRMTVEPEKASQENSSCPHNAFSTGSDSPVRMDSSTSNWLDCTIMPSAEILSPSCTRRISPGTISCASNSFRCPSLSKVTSFGM